MVCENLDYFCLIIFSAEIEIGLLSSIDIYFGGQNHLHSQSRIMRSFVVFGIYSFSFFCICFAVVAFHSIFNHSIFLGQCSLKSFVFIHLKCLYYSCRYQKRMSNIIDDVLEWSPSLALSGVMEKQTLVNATENSNNFSNESKANLRDGNLCWWIGKFRGNKSTSEWYIDHVRLDRWIIVPVLDFVKKCVISTEKIKAVGY